MRYEEFLRGNEDNGKFFEQMDYLAGKITGDANYKEKFREAAERFTAAGYTVLNPADLPEGMEKEDYMRMCLAMMFTADAVAFLPDWQESLGATIEHKLAVYCDKWRLMPDESGTFYTVDAG